jgi:hypothetical protein
MLQKDANRMVGINTNAGVDCHLGRVALGGGKWRLLPFVAVLIDWLVYAQGIINFMPSGFFFVAHLFNYCQVNVFSKGAFVQPHPGACKESLTLFIIVISIVAELPGLAILSSIAKAQGRLRVNSRSE